MDDLPNLTLQAAIIDEATAVAYAWKQLSLTNRSIINHHPATMGLGHCLMLLEERVYPS